MKTLKETIAIILSVLIILLLANRNIIFGKIENEGFSLAVGIVSAVIGVGCIFILVYSVKSIISKKHKETKVSDPSVRFTALELVALAEKCDVVEILAAANNDVVRVGTTSDSLPGKSQLFDKKYYIGEYFYDDANAFQQALCEKFPDGIIDVVKIDGVDPSQYKKK